MKLSQYVTHGLASAIFFVGCGLSSVASAANDTPGNATQAPVDNAWVDSFIGAGLIQRYYLTGFFQGRSYCVEVQPNANQIDVPFFDSETFVFTDNTGATVLSLGDDWFREPYAGNFSKNCFIWTAATDTGRLINIQECCGRPAPTPGTNFFFRFRIVDTTLNGPWFFVDAASSYNGFVEIANTTVNSVNITVTIRNSAGATIGTPQSRLVAGYGNLALNARTDFGVTLTTGSGSVQVAHDGAPGAIIANVTSLSAQAGLSFDSPLTRRQNW
ncbi:MAG: hypothetical protein E6H74_11490 [Betaproteobacteria bacterium]|nr:MAG: hypothetical protein E6H74_11490 [Betaproteobacteria bacterium]